MTTVALILWPFIGIAFFSKLGVRVGIAATVIGGYLLLPTRGGFDLPLLPAVDKNFVPAVTALVLAMIFMGRDGEHYQPGWLPRSPVILVLLAVLVVGAVGTAMTNSDGIFTGAIVLQGLRPYDAGSMVMNLFVLLIPFFLARKFFASPQSHKTLLEVLAIAGAGYSFLALYEVRMSPQLNVMVYGYFPHDWIQHVRGGGFRPLVFLNHALWLAIFLCCAMLAAFGLWRIGGSKWRPWFLAAGLLMVLTLFLAKSFGAVVIMFILLPMIVFLPFRLQILATAAVAGVLITYPVLRANDLIPTEWVVAKAAQLAPGRDASLQYRLEMEDGLLAKSLQRPLFGWGGYSRGSVYDEEGRDTSVTDGQWIIWFSQGGWFKYVGEMGLLTYAVFALALRWRRYELDPATAVLSVVLAANMIDLIPNATETSVTYLLAGALAGRLEIVRQMEEKARRNVPVAGGRRDAGSLSPGPGRGTTQPGSANAALAAGDRAARGASPFTRFAAKPGRNT